MSAPTSRSSRCGLLLLALLALASAPDALAYFDPASGGLLLQMILGGIAGVALMIRIYWHKLLGLFGIETADPSEDESDDADDLDSGDGDEREEPADADDDEVRD